MIKAGKTYFWLFLYGIAMGVLEAVIVIYLRQLYYPLGFDFPLKAMDPRMVSIEILREAATLVMLVALGALAGRSRTGRFAYFLFSFGVWDIFYYACLKLLLGWPASLFTWDILFLIPITWTGPVLAPVICSVTMMGLSVAMVSAESRVGPKPLSAFEWELILPGALLIFSAFIWDFSALIFRGGFPEAVSRYTPERFHWFLFSCGELMIIAAIGSLIRKTRTRSAS